MSNTATFFPGTTPRGAPAAMALAGALLTGAALAAFLVSPADAGAGWLGAAALFAFSGCGALLFLAAQHLIRGRWRKLEAPLAAILAALPASALCALPVFLSLPFLYPWLRGGGSEISSFAAHWLTPGWFALRSLLILGLLGLIAFLLTPRARSHARAALALIVVPIIATVLAADWVQSRQPDYASSALGLQLVVMGATAALAAAILLHPRSPERDAGGGVAGGLLLMMMLLWAYLRFLPYFIARSSNLPPGVGWYETRSLWPWDAVLWLTAIGGAGVIAALLFAAARRSPRASAIAAAVALAVMALDFAWFALPPNGALALPVFAAAAAGVAMLAGASAAFLPAFPVERP